MNIEPWVYWMQIGSSVLLLITCIKQMREQAKLRERILQSKKETNRWADKSTEELKRAHAFRMELIKTEQARDSILRLNAKQVQELQNYKSTLQEIANTPEGMTINRFAPYSALTVEPANIYTPREFAQEALKRGGKVSWKSRS